MIAQLRHCVLASLPSCEDAHSCVVASFGAPRATVLRNSVVKSARTVLEAQSRNCLLAYSVAIAYLRKVTTPECYPRVKACLRRAVGAAFRSCAVVSLRRRVIMRSCVVA